MTIRNGMGTLVNRLRGLGDVGTVDFTINSTTYWNDDQLQDILDQFQYPFYREALQRIDTYAGANNLVSLIYHSPRHFLEGTASGTALVRIENSNGVIQTGFTLDTISGKVTFASDTDGADMFMTGFYYDINGAASELWREKAARVAEYYSFATDDQRFQRSEWFNNAMRQSREFARYAKRRAGKMERGDI